MAFKYSEVVPWGRSYDEYCRMFDLTQKDLGKVYNRIAAASRLFGRLF